jgi:hypothetical protein
VFVVGLWVAFVVWVALASGDPPRSCTGSFCSREQNVAFAGMIALPFVLMVLVTGHLMIAWQRRRETALEQDPWAFLGSGRSRRGRS